MKVGIIDLKINNILVFLKQCNWQVTTHSIIGAKESLKNIN